MEFSVGRGAVRERRMPRENKGEGAVGRRMTSRAVRGSRTTWRPL